MDRLKGRKTMVTGASRGIGAALAERMAAEGAEVVVVARTLERKDHPLAGSLTETMERCRTYGTKVEAVVADLADPESRSTTVARAQALLGGSIEILVNNAAAAIYQPLLEYAYKRARISFEMNLHAPLELAQAVVPGMIERGEGWIINVSSATARHVEGPPFRKEGVAGTIGMYGASKAALNRMTNALALELHGSGVRVNTVEPRAGVMTEGAEALVGDTVSADLYESMEEMVEATLALCECPPDHTGRVEVSLDLLERLGSTVMTLDGSAPFVPPGA